MPCAVLALWVFFLRWNYFDRQVWNLDEGIYATAARSILDGGVMYRDAIDQRTPLIYYVVAGMFRVFGENNMRAVHGLLAGMIVVTALGLYWLGRRWRGAVAGIWSALIFCACTTNLLYIGDAHSLSTEWFVIFFTTWSTWWFWRTWEQKSFWRAGIAGLGFATAFLSKQPGLLDFGAPLATLVYFAAAGRLRPVEAIRQLAGLFTGFVTTIALVVAYFRHNGALGDFYFYAFSYNLLYYGPETTMHDRMEAALEGLKLIWQNYPVIAVALGTGVLGRLVGLVQRRPNDAERAINPAAFYLLIWTLLSWAAAASSGRIYGHYYLQLLPAFSLLAGWFLADCRSWFFSSRHKFIKVSLALVLAAAGWSVVAGPLRGPWPSSLGPDAGTDAATYIRAHSKPSDRIFVWGYHPDFYLIADRRAASRYIYCSFLTGLIPWTNTQPGRDTGYAIVPGTMEILLGELAANRPEYFVDTSLAIYRGFNKYPVAHFPALAAWVAANYLELEPERFRPHGFRVLRLKDSGRTAPLPLRGDPPDGLLTEPCLTGLATVGLATEEYRAQASHPGGRLQRMELLIDDRVEERLSFDPVTTLSVNFPVHFERLGCGSHQLKIRATSASGETRTSAALMVECSTETFTADQKAAFALPLYTAGPIPKLLRAPFGALAQQEAGALVFFAHAPSVISYPIPAKSIRLRGNFGFRPGAYAATNPGRTDGAEFVITWISPRGQRTELLRQLLRPTEEPRDRGDHAFDLAIPESTQAGDLEFAINCGPMGNAASDWTYWSDLVLSTSR